MELKDRIEDFETYLETQTRSSITTVKKYKSIVRLFLYDNLAKMEKDNGQLEITLEMINNWLTYKNKDKATTHYKFALRQFLLSLGQKDISEKLTPAKHHKRIKTFKFIAKSKMQAIINAMSTKWQPIAFMQIKTGARIGTIMTLRAENIDFNYENLIYIDIGVNKTMSKRSKEMKLRLSKKYEGLLRSWIKRPYGFIFLDNKCEAMTEKELISHLDTQTRYFNIELNKAGRIFGIDDLSSHYLRHLFSDYFLNAGGDPVYLQKALGHSKLETTLRYVSISDKMVDKTIMEMEN